MRGLVAVALADSQREECPPRSDKCLPAPGCGLLVCLHGKVRQAPDSSLKTAGQRVRWAGVETSIAAAAFCGGKNSTPRRSTDSAQVVAIMA